VVQLSKRMGMESLTSNGMSRLREPGLWRNDPHLERYVVPGGGAIILELHSGDELTVIDVEGCQIGELVPFNCNGNSDPEALTERITYPARGFQEILGANHDSRSSLMSKLRSWDYDLDTARAIRLFSRDSSSGEQDSFVSQRRVRCVICAPGSPMAVDEQTPPTSLIAWVCRAVRSEIMEPALPEPLAEPRLDFRISKCTARDYEVREGEYVQIIDVAGRECSDFMVFDQFFENAYIIADSNHGFKMIGVGELVAGELMGSPNSLLEPFRMSRFIEGKQFPVSNSPFPWS